MGNVFEKEAPLRPVVIVLETQTEIDQLYTLLNYTPIAKMLNDENAWWDKVYALLQTRKTSAYRNYHKTLEDFLGDS